MTEVLGLPLDLALDRLGKSGIDDIEIQRCDAPRAKNTRGTLRVVRVRDGGKLLTVSLFPDDVYEADVNETESC